MFDKIYKLLYVDVRQSQRHACCIWEVCQSFQWPAAAASKEGVRRPLQAAVKLLLPSPSHIRSDSGVQQSFILLIRVVPEGKPKKGVHVLDTVQSQKRQSLPLTSLVMFLKCSHQGLFLRPQPPGVYGFFVWGRQQSSSLFLSLLLLYAPPWCLVAGAASRGWALSRLWIQLGHTAGGADS